jgi:acetyltransferase
MTHCVIDEIEMTSENQIDTLYSKTGQRITVRPLRGDDAPLLVDIFDNMTAESRYRRFHQTVENVSATRKQQEAESIAQANPKRNLGLIAFSETQGKQNVPIGAVRMVLTEPHEAEIAISIRDDFQNMGIGTQLMNLLAEKAKQQGLERLVADIQNENVAIWRVIKKLPYKVQRTPEGNYSRIVISLNSPQDGIGRDWKE